MSLENVHSCSITTTLTRKGQDRDNRLCFLLKLLFAMKNCKLLRMDNTLFSNPFQITKTKLPFGQVVTHFHRLHHTKAAVRLPGPAGRVAHFQDAAEGMETAQPSSFPGGGRDKSKLTYVGDTQGLGALCHQVGPHPRSQLQMPREGGALQGRLPGRRRHLPELPRCLFEGLTEATLQDSKPAWKPCSLGPTRVQGCRCCQSVLRRTWKCLQVT